jgi:flagellar hook-basal body protein
MSFYTSLTGLNAATAQLGVTANNVANVSTVGFKRSRADFGDIFATSPLQKASATIGQGVSLKRVTQEFGQGNMTFSSNTLDLAISGDGFFPLKSQDGFQDIFTRNGSFMMNDQFNVVNSAGQRLMAASVDSSGKANLTDMNVLTIPQKTNGMATQTSKVQLGLNFPADAPVITAAFNRNDPTTYNKSTALTVYDGGGNGYLATVYYAKTRNASQASPNNKWQTYVYVGDQLVNASLQQATSKTGDLMYVNKYGELKAKGDFKSAEEVAALNSSFSKKTYKFSLNQLTDVRTSQPAAVTGGSAINLGTGSNDGVDFASYMNLNKSDLLWKQGSSAVTYSLSTSGVPTDSVTLTFGPTGAKTTVSVPVEATKELTTASLAKALNANSDFGAKYVAQVPTSATLPTVSFNTPAAAGDFSSFGLNLGGKTITINNLAPDSATGASLAAAIESRLRREDSGATDISVSWVGAGTPASTTTGSLKVVDATGRAITSATLIPTATAGNTASSTGTPIFTSGDLKITAIDPNLPATDIASAITVAQAGTPLAASAINLNNTPYPRSSADYTFDTTSASFKATFGPDASPITVTANSVGAFVLALNSEATFAQNYVASAVGGVVTVTAKDPTTANAAAITGALKFYQGNGTAFTQINDPTNPVGTNGVPSAPAFAGKKSIDDLKDLFSINVDNSIDPVTIGLDRLVGSNLRLSGAQIAAELTNSINRAYGDEKPFNFSSLIGPTFSIQLTPAGGATPPAKLDIDLSQAGDDKHNMRYEDMVKATQAIVDANPSYAGKVKVTYDTVLQKLTFTSSGNDKVTISSTQSSIGLTNPIVQGVNDESVGLTLAPAASTASYRAINDQRFGIKVEYDAVKGGFVFKSGTTGDGSSVTVSNIKPNSLATQTSKGLGLTGDPANYVVTASKIDALRGTASLPAVLQGNSMAVNVDNNFSVDDTNNKFVVSVNGVTGTVVIPPKDTYTLGTFMEALQSGINNLQGPSVGGLSPQTIDGVKVTYDSAKNSLVFTTSTASTDSYIKVTGDARWGVDGLDAQFGKTTTWIKPTPFKDTKGSTVYIDGFGKEASNAAGFDTLPEWSPIYLDKGELTFDTTGNLVSPKQGAQLDTVYLPNGKGSLTINIDYSKSTQFASPYAVLSQSQDGAPEGDLVGLAIKDDGLVNASYSNGSQKSLGKVVLVNFSNASGLRQIGDTSYYKTSDSGVPKYGEAGSAGYGTVRSGATERANVDLTQELVDLITEQRNFQANAKAMETSTSLTSTIIQIRN